MRTGTEPKQGRQRSALDKFEDGDVLDREDTPAPRELELELPTIALLAAAAFFALFYQATHPVDPNGPSQIIAWGSSDSGTSATSAAMPPALTPDPVPAASVPPVSDVSGEWALATLVESTGYKRFSGLTLGFQVNLTRDGDRVHGEGRKVTENGGELASTAQTPISVDGTIVGDRLTLAFLERGAHRPTEGTFDLRLAEDASLHGRFTTTAARSSGIVDARRIQ